VKSALASIPPRPAFPLHGMLDSGEEAL
jgi:hypothetical protein